MNELYTRFDNIFFEKTRLSLMTILYQEEGCSFNMLKNRMKLSDGALYTHLEKLIQKRFIRKKKEIAGKSVSTVYYVTPRGKKKYLEYIDFIEELLKEIKQ